MMWKHPKVFLSVLCLTLMTGCRVDEGQVKEFIDEVEQAVLTGSTPVPQAQDGTGETEPEGEERLPEDDEILSESEEVSTGAEDKSAKAEDKPKGAEEKSAKAEEKFAKAEETLSASDEISGRYDDKEKTNAIGLEYIDGEWGTDTPENRGISREQMDSFAREVGERPIRSALLIKDGSIVYEYYRGGYDIDTRFDIYSCTKSIVSAAAGMAMDQGYLEGTDTKITEFFPDIDDAGMKEITIGNLLNLTSGIEWTETLANGAFMLEWMMADNQVDYILNKNMVNKPGEVFNYSSADSHLLSAILAEVTGMSGKDYVSDNLLEPIGIEDVMWWEDSQGISFGGFGIFMTARDAARFGQLYLNKGMWGRDRIISEDWIDKSTKPQSPNGEYGYNWWIDTSGEQREYQMYYAAGLGGQYILVVPEYEIVAVIMSSGVGDMSVVRMFQSFLDEME